MKRTKIGIDEALRLHNELFFIELHSDYPVDLIRRRREGEKGVMQRIWLPMIEAGGVNASCFIIGGDTAASGKTIDDVLETLIYLDDEIAALGGKAVLATSVSDLEFAFCHKQIAIILGLEGVGPLGLRLTNLQFLHKQGLRMAQLTWNHRNMVADGFADNCSGGGLSSYGRVLLEEMNRLRIIVDMSHLSRQSTADVLRFSTTPVICSHTNCLSLCNHPRNLDDANLKLIAEKGGLVGLCFYPKFLRDDEKLCGMDDILRHLDHMLKIIGEDHIGIGPDYIHFSPEIIHKPPLPIYPPPVAQVDQLSNLTIELCRRGYPERILEKIYGRNFLRVAKDIWGI